VVLKTCINATLVLEHCYKEAEGQSTSTLTGYLCKQPYSGIPLEDIYNNYLHCKKWSLKACENPCADLMHCARCQAHVHLPLVNDWLHQSLQLISLTLTVAANRGRKAMTRGTNTCTRGICAAKSTGLPFTVYLISSVTAAPATYY
jgi:hypothetical protein